MVEAQVISKSSYVRAAWKNGLGHTDQIAIEPAGADLRKGDFLFRLSSARIERASPFSPFPEHDRTLVVLDGMGIRLVHTYPEGGEEEAQEIAPDAPCEFPGDLPSRCELIDGPVTDLSLFVRKGVAEGVTEMATVSAGERFAWLPAGRWNFLFAVDGAVVVSAPGVERRRLDAGDTLRVRLSAPLSEGDALQVESPDGRNVRLVLVGVQA